MAIETRWTFRDIWRNMWQKIGQFLGIEKSNLVAISLCVWCVGVLQEGKRNVDLNIYFVLM